jgi:predicted enzyme related to lactoylglutathione lyase
MVAGAMRNEGGGMPDGWSVYLATDDAQATAEAVEANGGQVLFPSTEVGDLGTMAVVNDAGAAAVGMWQPGLHKGFGVTGEPGTPAWFELFTRDYAKTVDFYRKVFRWDAHSVADSDEFRYTTLGEGDDQAAGIMDAGAWLPEGVPAHWSVYFAVADADATVAKAIELGGAVVVPPEDTPYGRIATLTDATGAQFKIVQDLQTS